MLVVEDERDRTGLRTGRLTHDDVVRTASAGAEALNLPDDSDETDFRAVSRGLSSGSRDVENESANGEDGPP